ncbi:hypothetical protein C1646_132240, partial [Rhizophagus diaphanus]
KNFIKIILIIINYKILSNLIFLFIKISFSTFSGFKLLRLFVIKFPTSENSLSEGTDVAEIPKSSLDNLLKNGNLLSLVFHQDNGSIFLTGLIFKYSSTSFSSSQLSSSPKMLSIKDLSKSISFDLSLSSLSLSSFFSSSSSSSFSSSALALFSNLYISYLLISKVVASCLSVILKRANFLDLGSKRLARKPTSEDTDQYFLNAPSSASKNNKTNPFVSTDLNI